MRPDFRRWYLDSYWDNVYRGAGKLHYREDIITEHLHPESFPERKDDVYKNMESCNFKVNDGNLISSPEVQQEIKRNIEILNSNFNKILLSFGTTDRYKFCLEALKRSTNIANINSLILLNESNIENDFYSENSKHFHDKKGFGYWIWKAYFINKFLNDVNDSIFFYIDSSNEIVKDLTPLYVECYKNDKGIILFDNRDGEPNGNIWKNNMWTKSDCFNLMDLKDDKYIYGNQINASYILFRKTEFSVAFFKEFLMYCKNYNIISDAPNITKDFNKDFRAYRHDQSILSLLSIKHGITILRDPSQWGIKNQFFLHQRGKYLR